MSSFGIPGLGFAKPNEVLPPVADSTPDDARPGEAAPSAPVPEGSNNNQTEGNREIVSGSKEQEDIQMGETSEATQPTQNPQGATATTASTGPEPTATSNGDEQGDTNKQGVQATESNGDAAPNSSEDPMKVDEATPRGASLTDDLEAAIGGLGPFPAAAPEQQQASDIPQEQQEAAGEHPEWEADSSPYESSTESDSSDSSSEEDSDDEQFQGLSIEETARLLMEADAGSDDEERGDRNPRSQVRTKNELPETIMPKPDVTITPEMKIEELGAIEHIVDTTVVIKAYTPGEYQVIDSGSVLCTAERTVIGALADVLGKVQEPLYTVSFNTPEEISEAGLQVGTKVFYSVNHANYVFTQALKNLKGSDASNLHDEEVGEDEAEFSDDEKEAEYKRKLKQKRRERQGGDSRGRGGQRGPHPLRNEVSNGGPSSGLSYDDGGEDDGPYKPLSRPPGYGAGGFGGSSEEPPPGTHRSQRGGRGAFSRGRGGQSRGRGFGRGRGGAGNGADAPPRDGYSMPPQGQQPYSQPNVPGGGNGMGFGPQAGTFNFQAPSTQQPGHPAPAMGGFPAPAWPQAFPNPPFPGAPFPPAGWPGPQPPPSGTAPPQNGAPLLNPALLALLSTMAAQNQNRGQQQPPDQPSWRGPPS